MFDYIPIDETKTTPRPIASGPPIYRNLSLGAQIARVDRPEQHRVPNNRFKLELARSKCKGKIELDKICQLAEPGYGNLAIRSIGK